MRQRKRDYDLAGWELASITRRSRNTPLAAEFFEDSHLVPAWSIPTTLRATTRTRSPCRVTPCTTDWFNMAAIGGVFSSTSTISATRFMRLLRWTELASIPVSHETFVHRGAGIFNAQPVYEALS